MKRRIAKPESLLAAIAMTQHAIEESRRIMNDLRPSLLDDLGIVVTTRWFCRQFQSVYENIALEKEIELEERDVPEFLKIVIFRITQEALHNVAKHSGATAVKLSIAKRGGFIDLAIRDNGVGFDLPSVLSREGPEKGLGIASMKERTELAGGTFSVESTDGIGTTIRAVWPVGEREA
jgi:signal transduction histidine kinase